MMLMAEWKRYALPSLPEKALEMSSSYTTRCRVSAVRVKDTDTARLPADTFGAMDVPAMPDESHTSYTRTSVAPHPCP